MFLWALMHKKCIKNQFLPPGFIIVIEPTCQSHVKRFRGNIGALSGHPVACCLGKCLTGDLLYILLIMVCMFMLEYSRLDQMFS